MDFREIRAQDAEVLFKWRNEESVRAVSVTKEPLDWSDHVSWVTSIAARVDETHLLFELENVPIGRVSVGANAEVSIIIDPGFRGKGYGVFMLHKCLSVVRETRMSVSNVKALISPDNIVSKKLFEKAGFVFVGEEQRKGTFFLVFTRWLHVIPYGKQDIADDDVSVVARALKNSLLTTGPEVLAFEQQLARMFGSCFAVVCSSGTAALHLACMAVGLSAGDELITSPLTFAASANCALYCGARPVFVDVNSSGLMDDRLIAEKLSARTKVVLPVHYAGQACDMEAIYKIAVQHGIRVIEDGCHSPKAKYGNGIVGDCKYSDMCCFSLHPVKHFTTAEGGFVTTNCAILYEKLKRLRSHGMTKDPSHLSKLSEGSWYYEIPEVGYNYRLPDVLCALGQSQLQKLDGFILARQKIANEYLNSLAGLPLQMPRVLEGRTHVYHLFVILVEDGLTRRKLFDFLNSVNVATQVHYVPVYWHPCYGSAHAPCKMAENFYQRCLSIPIFPSLSHNQQQYVIHALRQFFRVPE